MRQLDIFDVMPAEEADWHQMTLEQIAKTIGNALGLVFTKSQLSDFLGERYSARKNKLSLTVKIGVYACQDRKGEKFIGCDTWTSSGGCACNRDSIEDAVEFFKREVERYENE